MVISDAPWPFFLPFNVHEDCWKDFINFLFEKKFSLQKKRQYHFQKKA